MIIILGAQGFLGSAFCRVCNGRGIPHQGIDLDNYAQCKGSRCETLINADGNSKKYLAEADPVRDFELSVDSVMRSFFDFSFRRYVYISSVAVYTDHANPGNNSESAPVDVCAQSNYGFHKYCAERLVMKYCGDWIILRVGGLVGPCMSKGPVFDIMRRLPLRINPSSRFQFINTEEIAAITLKMLDDAHCTREFFNLSGRGTVTLREIQEMTGHVEENSLPVETWNINVDKVHKRFGLPTTHITIRDFISGQGLQRDK